MMTTEPKEFPEINAMPSSTSINHEKWGLQPHSFCPAVVQMIVLLEYALDVVFVVTKKPVTYSNLRFHPGWRNAKCMEIFNGIPRVCYLRTPLHSTFPRISVSSSRRYLVYLWAVTFSNHYIALLVDCYTVFSIYSISVLFMAHLLQRRKYFWVWVISYAFNPLCLEATSLRMKYCAKSNHESPAILRYIASNSAQLKFVS